MMNDRVISVWKNTGLTSFDVLRAVKKELNLNKVGHCGTLDPFAEGVLVLCTGKKTKEIDYFMNYEKEYIATISLGDETDTLDITGDIVKSKKNKKLKIKTIKEVIENYKGNISQTPPYYSALKFHGIRLYKYARKGIYIRKKPRKVHIKKISFLNLEKNLLNFQ